MKALLADLDGTLADTAPGLVAAAITAANELGVELLSRDVDRLRGAAARGAASLLQAMTGQPPADTLLDAMLDHYEAIIGEHTQLFSGTESWLSLPRFGIVTNKPWRFARHLLGAVLPADVLLVCPDHVGARKPDPAPVRFALERLGVSPEQTVLVGDDLADRDAAHLAGGVGFIAALWGYGAGDWMDEQPLRAASPDDVPGFL